MSSKQNYSVENVSTDSAVLSFIVWALLPASKDRKYTSFEEIMQSNMIRNFKTPREHVMRMLNEEFCSSIFDRRRIDWKNPTIEEENNLEFRIDASIFFTNEERADPNCLYWKCNPDLL